MKVKHIEIIDAKFPDEAGFILTALIDVDTSRFWQKENIIQMEYIYSGEKCDNSPVWDIWFNDIGMHCGGDDGRYVHDKELKRLIIAFRKYQAKIKGKFNFRIRVRKYSDHN